VITSELLSVERKIGLYLGSMPWRYIVAVTQPGGNLTGPRFELRVADGAFIARWKVTRGGPPAPQAPMLFTYRVSGLYNPVPT
jgi:hypothetical protein